MGRDVFISYSKQDTSFAEAVCDFMERRGVTCWIAPRDIAPGADFALAILDGIDEASAVVLILSNASNTSRFVQSEVNRAFSKGKSIFTFRVSDVMPSRQLKLYLASQQWLDGFPPPIEQKLDRLTSVVLSLQGLGETAAPQPPTERTPAPSPAATSVSSGKAQAIARRFIDWLKRYDHHGDTSTESFKSFIVADKCIVEYGTTYAEYVAVAELVRKSGVDIDWIIPADTFEFLVAESKRKNEGRHA
jgi:hypothetical protein